MTPLEHTKGISWYDKAFATYMVLVQGGEWDGWLIRFDRDRNQWVSVRRANRQDIARVMAFVLASDDAGQSFISKS